MHCSISLSLWRENYGLLDRYFSVIFTASLLLTNLVGCTHTTLSLNPFQAKIIYKKNATANRSANLQEPESRRVVILVHGLYGDDKTFGDLANIIIEDQSLRAASVYTMKYWTNRLFPNFQRLADLGAEMEKHLITIASNEPSAEIVVIAHSQGGLITRNAVLSLKDKSNDALLDRIRVVMIGTPNYASLYATYNNLIVNSVFAPITYVSTLITSTLLPPLVYNRQAYDMAQLGVPGFQNPDRSFPPFMRNMILRWARAFPTGTNGSPKMYAIVGVKNLLGHYDLSDGVVHSLNTLFVGLPGRRVHYVPYKHFGEEATIEGESHHTYKVIRKILTDNDETDSGEQRLLPFPDITVSWVTFVGQVTDKDEDEEVEIEHVSLEPASSAHASENRFDAVKRVAATKKREFRSDPGRTIGNLMFFLGTYPFELLQTLIEPSVEIYDGRHDPRPEWQLLTVPGEVMEGEYEASVSLSRRTKGEGWFRGKEKTKVTIPISNTHDAASTNCRVEYPIQWGSRTQEESDQRLASPNQNLRIIPNSVNFIEAIVHKNEATGSDLLILSTGNCIASPPIAPPIAG